LKVVFGTSISRIWVIGQRPCFVDPLEHHQFVALELQTDDNITDLLTHLCVPLPDGSFTQNGCTFVHGKFIFFFFVFFFSRVSE
jgi:hypothetical protein